MSTRKGKNPPSKDNPRSPKKPVVPEPDTFDAPFAPPPIDESIFGKADSEIPPIQPKKQVGKGMKAEAQKMGMMPATAQQLKATKNALKKGGPVFQKPLLTQIEGIKPKDILKHREAEVKSEAQIKELEYKKYKKAIEQIASLKCEIAILQRKSKVKDADENRFTENQLKQKKEQLAAVIDDTANVFGFPQPVIERLRKINVEEGKIPDADKLITVTKQTSSNTATFIVKIPPEIQDPLIANILKLCGEKPKLEAVGDRDALMRDIQKHRRKSVDESGAVAPKNQLRTSTPAFDSQKPPEMRVETVDQEEFDKYFSGVSRTRGTTLRNITEYKVSLEKEAVNESKKAIDTLYTKFAKGEINSAQLAIDIKSALSKMQGMIARREIKESAETKPTKPGGRLDKR